MVNFASEISNRVDLLLKQKGIAVRHGAGSGIFVSLLLPISILKGEFTLYLLHNQTKLWIPLCLGLLLHSILSIIYVKKNVPLFNGFALVPALLLSFTVTYLRFNQGALWKAAFTCLLIFLYDDSVLKLMKVIPKAFSYGEACVVCQAVVLFISSCFSPSPDSTCISNATSVLKVGTLCVVGISVVSFTFDLRSNLTLFSSFVLFVVCLILLPVCHLLIGISPLLWIYQLVTSDWNTSMLFCYWLACSSLGVLAVVYQIHIKKKANTIVRKSFHVLSLLVYFPGIIVNPCLMYLASGIVFAVFLMADVIRVGKVPIVSSALQEGFMYFADEKDSGGLSLTPLYLVAGCSFPLWIHPTPSLLPLISGLLTVAIGDTAASICGSLFGKNKWKGTYKTVEGTIACFISQLFFVLALIHFEYLPRKDLVTPVIAISVSSLVEARTSQVDNLVLPLLMYIIVV